MKILNLKQMTIAAMLGTSLLLTGCGGGGGGGGSVTPISDQPISDQPISAPVAPTDPTLGTYLEGVNLDEAAADTKAIATYGTEFRAAIGFAQNTTDALWTTLDAAGADYYNDEYIGTLATVFGISVEDATHLYTIADLDSNGQLSKDELLVSNRYADDAGVNMANAKAFYDRINIEGLKEAHSEGWTGLGVNIGIFDTGIHGIEVSDTAVAVAPGADVLYFNNDSSSAFSGMDITNHSYGWDDRNSSTITNLATWAGEHYNEVDLNNPDALHIIATPNAGNCNANDLVMCDGAAAAFVATDLDGSYIFVGAQSDTGYNSTPVGSNLTLQQSFLVADGYGIGDSPGTSFAAPKVAGAAALVQHKFSNVDASQTALILLNTADQGFTGFDADIHGQGKLDVGAALSPVGNLH